MCRNTRFKDGHINPCVATHSSKRSFIDNKTDVGRGVAIRQFGQAVVVDAEVKRSSSSLALPRWSNVAEGKVVVNLKNKNEE